MYGAPVYFGIIYGAIRGGWGPLRLLTIGGSLVSVCFAYREKRDDNERGSLRPRRFAGTVAVMGLLFLGGFLADYFGR
jgi:hypothetical protein